MIVLKGLTYLERTQQALINAHHGARVVKFSAIIRRTEKRYQLSLREELIAIFHDLVGATDEIHVVFLQEARYNVGTKGEGYATVVFTPARNVFIRIRPQQIAEKTTIRNLYISLDQYPRSPVIVQPLQYDLSLTSVGLITLRICSIELRSGLSPPCMVNIFSSMIAAIGRQLKQSVKVFHNLMLYRLLHSS